MVNKPIESVAPFVREAIEKVRTPCPAYSGHVAAVRTYNGIPIIVMAASKTQLVDAVREINPRISINLSLCEPASIIHEQNIVRNKSVEDDEEL